MIKAAFFGLLLAFAVTTHAKDCEYPNSVKLPNGKNATKEDMLAGQKDVKAYISDAETYLTCIEERELENEAKSELPADDPVNLERKALWNKRHNAMVAEMEAVADNFNTEVRAYKAENK